MNISRKLRFYQCFIEEILYSEYFYWVYLDKIVIYLQQNNLKCHIGIINHHSRKMCFIFKRQFSITLINVQLNKLYRQSVAQAVDLILIQTVEHQMHTVVLKAVSLLSQCVHKRPVITIDITVQNNIKIFRDVKV